MFLFLIFPGTVITEEEDQVGPQAPEDPHNSSTDSCLTFPFLTFSNSPRPFPPSPVHSVTDSPIRVSPLFIATSNNSPVHRSIDHYSPVPTSSTSPLLNLPKPLLLSIPVRLLILSIILSISLTFLVLFLRQDL